MSILDDIAAKSKVSRSSVAKILRGKPGFNENTRQRVLKVAKQLNYRPSYVGRALAGAKSMEANFHSTLDVRYAISKGIVWSAFIHPMSDLSDDLLRSAIQQVAIARVTFGKEYTSGAMVFGGADEN